MANKMMQSGQVANYNLSAPTYLDGEPSSLQVDIEGNLKTTANGYNYKYQAAAAANVVVKATAGYLKGIIIGGLPIADAIIEVSDHATDGDGNVQIYVAGGDASDNLLQRSLKDLTKGYIPVEAYFATGICADITAQTHVTFIFR